MQLKGPFKFTDNNIYFVPSKPGVFLLGDSDGHVVYVGKSDANLGQRLREYANKLEGKATQFWYYDTWSQTEANNLEEKLAATYSPLRDAAGF